MAGWTVCDHKDHEGKSFEWAVAKITVQEKGAPKGEKVYDSCLDHLGPLVTDAFKVYSGNPQFMFISIFHYDRSDDAGDG